MPAELARLKRDLDSLEEEIAVSTGARARSPLSDAQKRSFKADMQACIQKLDELSGRLTNS